MRIIFLVFLSFSLYAQYPDWVMDSLIYETKLSRQCDTLQLAQQAEINALTEQLSTQGRIISLKTQEIDTQTKIIGGFPRQVELIHAQHRIEVEGLKREKRGLKRWLLISGVGNVLLVVALIL